MVGVDLITHEAGYFLVVVGIVDEFGQPFQKQFVMILFPIYGFEFVKFKILRHAEHSLIELSDG